MSPTPCNRADALGRLTKAEQFYGAAEDIRVLASEESDIGDAYVTLCVHAGIAAADAICCIELGEHSQGQTHHEAVQLIKVGGKSRLVCPSGIAYGDRGSPPVIKPGATLVFEVELLDIVKQ